MSNVVNQVSAGPSIMEWMAEHYVTDYNQPDGLKSQIEHLRFLRINFHSLDITSGKTHFLNWR